MVSWQKGYLNVTWDEFRSLIFTLSQKIQASSFKPNLIVTIARGGLCSARMLSDLLTLPIAAFTIQSYTDLQQSGIPHITYGLDASLHDKKILLVDDVSDTGKTFIRGLAYLEELGAAQQNVRTVATHYKPHASYKPDFYAAETSDWIIYPYEPYESLKTLAKKWQQKGASKLKIKKLLQKWQFDAKVIDFVLKI